MCCYQRGRYRVEHERASFTHFYKNYPPRSTLFLCVINRQYRQQTLPTSTEAPASRILSLIDASCIPYFQYKGSHRPPYFGPSTSLPHHGYFQPVVSTRSEPHQQESPLHPSSQPLQQIWSCLLLRLVWFLHCMFCSLHGSSFGSIHQNMTNPITPGILVMVRLSTAVNRCHQKGPQAFHC